MVYIIAFKTDGGCRNNGYPNAFGAAAAVRFYRNHSCKHHRKLLPHTIPTPTSQRAELTAIILALEVALKACSKLHSCPLVQCTIKTDSQYAVKCLTEWAHEWRRKDWKTSKGTYVANRDLIEGALAMGEEVKAWGTLEYEFIRRERNTAADGECRRVLDRIAKE